MTGDNVVSNVDKIFADFLERNKYKSWLTGEALQAIRTLQTNVSQTIQQINRTNVHMRDNEI